MPTQEDVDAIKKEVRDFFAEGTKSVNKYYAKQSEPTTFEDKTISVEKKEKRLKSLSAEIQGEIMKNREILKKKKGTITPSRWGQIIQEQGRRAGNCQEMSCLAVYLCEKRGFTSYLVEINYPGDHVFCVAAPPTPALTPIMNYKLNPPANTWVIDPWANIACPAGEYVDKLKEKFRVWTGQTKRVAWQKSATAAPTWVEPSNVQYWGATITSSLVYRPANTPFG